jgi:hypothetical protein
MNPVGIHDATAGVGRRRRISARPDQPRRRRRRRDHPRSPSRVVASGVVPIPDRATDTGSPARGVDMDHDAGGAGPVPGIPYAVGRRCSCAWFRGPVEWAYGVGTHVSVAVVQWTECVESGCRQAVACGGLRARSGSRVPPCAEREVRSLIFCIPPPCKKQSITSVV